MTVIISGDGLTIEQIAAVVGGERVELTDDRAVLDRMERSRAVLRERLARNEAVYGVSTLFGAMADQHVPDARRRRG